MKGHDDQQMPGAEHASSSDPFEGEGFGANGILEPKPWTNRLGAAALLLAALIALASLGSLGPAEAWARHTYEVIDRARATLAMIVDVETGSVMNIVKSCLWLPGLPIIPTGMLNRERQPSL